MTGKRIGVGMLGAGFIAEYHLAGLAATGRADVRTIVARTPAGARALADRFDVADVETDIAAVLMRDDIDAVVVATPDHTHEAVAIAAARAGKAVLLQKPMAGSLAAATRIAEAAAEQGIDLQVSFMHRFFDEVVLARRWIADGMLGRIHGARIRNATPGPDWGDWFFRKANVPHGVADQLGVHGIDLVEHLLGPIRNVGARARTAMPVRTLRDGRRVEVETVDNVNAAYELDDGTLVSHEISQTEVAGCDRFRMEIYGERGTLWLRSERGHFAAVVPERYGPDWQVPQLVSTPMGKRQHDAWLAGVAGDGPRLATARDALRGMRVVEAMMRSSDLAGARVEVAGVLTDLTDSVARTAAEATGG
jgi:predicted dehydrogenase